MLRHVPDDYVHAENCDLCEAARITQWFHEDDVCWIAECEICAVPMVVWRGHGTEPPPEELAHMHAQLAQVVEAHFTYEHYVDDNMRNIPDHYHAHARPRGGFFGHGLRRRQQAQHPRPLPPPAPTQGGVLRPRLAPGLSRRTC